MPKTVAVIGASSKPERFSYQAVELLRKMGHQVFPVRPGQDYILGVPCYAHLRDIKEPVHTVTLYVGAQKSSELAGEIIVCKPVRVIFNPGAENPELAAILEEAGIEAIEDCTLVLLRNNDF